MIQIFLSSWWRIEKCALVDFVDGEVQKSSTIQTASVDPACRYSCSMLTEQLLQSPRETHDYLHSLLYGQSALVKCISLLSKASREILLGHEDAASAGINPSLEVYFELHTGCCKLSIHWGTCRTVYNNIQ